MSPVPKPTAAATYFRLEDARPMYKLTIEGLHKSYGEHQVLKGVSLKARTGDVISLIGASGSGKSTFLRCINFLEQPNDGAMSLDGPAIRMINDRHGMRVADEQELQIGRASGRERGGQDV